MDTIEQLKLRIAELEAENKQLRTLLKLPVKYSESVAKEDNVYDQNQGKHIVTYSITKDAANYFYSLFWGRKDVYALRVVNKNTGKAAYYPQCVNFYKPGCYRRDKLKTSCSECPMLQYKALQLDTIIAHLVGKKSDGSDVVGIYPLFEDGTCRFIVFDFDDHENDETIGLNEKIKQEVDALRKISDVVGIYPLFEDGTCRFIVFDFDDHENDETIGLNEKIKQEVDALRKICILQGFEPLVERSRSGKGAHVWLLFNEPIDAKIARQFGYGLLNAGLDYVSLSTFNYFDRMLPMQDAHVWLLFNEPIDAKIARQFGYGLLNAGLDYVSLSTFNYFDRMLPMQDKSNKLGNLIALPLQGNALKSGNSAFVDNNWLDYVSLSTFNYFDRMLPMQDKSNKLGNLIALPLQGNALKSGNSAFVENNWNAYKDQWLYLHHVKKINKPTIISKLHEWNIAINDQSNAKNTLDKPWSRDEAFDSGDINVKEMILMCLLMEH